MRHQGRITKWMDDKGFGFITPNSGGKEVFVHISSLANRQRRPKENDLVTYTLKVDSKGRAQANAVSLLGVKPGKSASHRRSNLPPIFAVCFLAVVVAAVIAGRLPILVLALYLGTSLVTFLAYAMDKSAAVRNRWRTKENTLHLFALLGGWPGALAAQRLLRHKSAKSSFQVVFWTTVVLNGGALGWLLSEHGVQTLQSVLRFL